MFRGLWWWFWDGGGSGETVASRPAVWLASSPSDGWAAYPTQVGGWVASAPSGSGYLAEAD